MGMGTGTLGADGNGTRYYRHMPGRIGSENDWPLLRLDPLSVWLSNQIIPCGPGVTIGTGSGGTESRH